MTNNPKKHIIDSLLREIYGEISPPDQSDEILRRLEAGDSSLKSDARLQESPANNHESRPSPAISCNEASAPGSKSPNWMVVAATLIFCVGLIGAVARVLVQTDGRQQVAENDDNSTDSDQNAADSLKRSKSLKVNDLASQSVNPNDSVPGTGKTNLKSAVAQSSEKRPNSTHEGELDVKPFSTNPLPTFAEHAKRLPLLDVQNRVDQALSENWRVNVIHAPDSMSGSKWLAQVFEKILGRQPESSEIANFEQYLADGSLPAIEIQLRIVESILSNESTEREFSDRWADRFLDYLVQSVPDPRKVGSRPEVKALRTYLREAFRQKAPLNQVVYKMLASNGSVDPKALKFNAAAGFVALTGNDPNLLAENISRSFLGTEISCARCHTDVVYEQSRADYLGLTSFLQGTNVTRKQTGFAVVEESATSRRVPGLFYNRKNGSAVYATPMIAGHDAKLDQQSGRETLAEQLVRSDRFAKTMVDWVWSEVYGYGLSRKGRVGHTHNSPHHVLMADLAEQVVANDFDFRTMLKWTILSRAFSSAQNPSADTLAKDIPKYGGVAFFSYRYEQPEHDPVESIERLATAYRQPEGLTTSARLSLNIKSTGKGIEIIDRMEQGILPDGLKVEDEIPKFAQGWGVESSRTAALDRIAGSKNLKLLEKVQHLYCLALHRAPTKAELNKALSLFKPKQVIEGDTTFQRSELEILQDLWWAICPR